MDKDFTKYESMIEEDSKSMIRWRVMIKLRFEKKTKLPKNGSKSIKVRYNSNINIQMNTVPIDIVH
jgi:hypothetical protein